MEELIEQKYDEYLEDVLGIEEDLEFNMYISINERYRNDEITKDIYEELLKVRNDILREIRTFKRNFLDEEELDIQMIRRMERDSMIISTLYVYIGETVFDEELE